MKLKIRVSIGLILCAIIFCSNLPAQAAGAEKKISSGAYKVTLNDVNEFFIGNEKKVSGEVGSSKICLIYTVEKSEKKQSNELVGIIATTEATVPHPYTAINGTLRTTGGDKVDFFTEGYTYFFYFERTENGIDYLAYKTNGKRAVRMNFYGGLGPNDAPWNHYGIWFRSFDGYTVNAVLKNVRCYDGDYNDRGVICTPATGTSTIEYSGEIADYSKSSGAYYCEETKELLVLDDKNNIYKIDAEGVQQDTAKYQIFDKNHMIVSGKQGKVVYECSSLHLKDEDGNTYRYLDNKAKVTFVTGEETFVVEPTLENKYRVEEPKAPTKEGNTFKGWYLGDATEYDFNSVVSKSITLYAKWQDGDGNEYLAVDTPIQDLEKGFDVAPVVAITASVIIEVLAVVACVMIIRKKVGKK